MLFRSVSQSRYKEGSLKIVSSDVGESSIKEVVRKSEISMLGLIGNTVSDEFQRSTEIESLQQFHMVSTEYVWDEITAAFHNCFPTIKERLINKKLITVSEKALEIKVLICM